MTRNCSSHSALGPAFPPLRPHSVTALPVTDSELSYLPCASSRRSARRRTRPSPRHPPSSRTPTHPFPVRKAGAIRPARRRAAREPEATTTSAVQRQLVVPTHRRLGPKINFPWSDAEEREDHAPVLHENSIRRPRPQVEIVLPRARHVEPGGLGQLTDDFVCFCPTVSLNSQNFPGILVSQTRCLGMVWIWEDHFAAISKKSHRLADVRFRQRQKLQYS